MQESGASYSGRSGRSVHLGGDSPPLASPPPVDGRTRSGGARIPLEDVPYRLPSPPSLPPLARRSPSLRERGVASPPAMKRRAFSYDDEPEPMGFSTGDDVGSGSSAASDFPTTLTTVPSQNEMDFDATDVSRRHSLYATPTRGGRRRSHGSVRRPHNHNSVRSRSRAVSSDIVLDIGDNFLPQYDESLAAAVSAAAAEETRASSFSTPDRPITRPFVNRDRANTCPHRPQRHAIFQGQRSVDVDDETVDEESGSLYRSETEIDPLPGLSLDGLGRADTSLMTPRHSTHNGSLIATENSPPVDVSPLATPVRPSSRPPLVTSLSSSNITRLQRNRLEAALRAARQRRDCILSYPHAMKALMIFSLYALLSYTWNTDLRVRYKTAEINYGLAEYWNGGLSSHFRIEKMGRRPKSGKMFNDDGADCGSLAALLAGDGSSSGDDRVEAGASGDSYDSVTDVMPSQLVSTDNGRRRPSLSYARSSVSDPSHAVYRMYGNRRTTAQKREWTASRLAWVVVWAMFALPVVEAGLREARRRLNFRLWGARRSRSSFRSSGVGGRAQNVHNL